MKVYYTFAYPEEKALEILQKAPLELSHRFDHVLRSTPQEGYVSFIHDDIYRPECFPIKDFNEYYEEDDKVCLDNLDGLIGFL